MTSLFSRNGVATLPRLQPAPESFRLWRDRIVAAGLEPVIIVAGSRGKTTVVRLLNDMFVEAGLRTAIWTNRGVEIEGSPQRGELVPWVKVRDRLTAGTLDVAIREVAWSTVRTSGLTDASAPIVTVTNVCANRDACMIYGEAKLAVQALPTLLDTASPDGLVVLNGEDFAVSGDEVFCDRPQWLVALTRATPLMREHLENNGTAAWIEDGQLTVGDQTTIRKVGEANTLAFSLHGAAIFQLHNGLTAAATAVATGLDAGTISRSLQRFRISPQSMPASFNTFEVNGAPAIVDRPEPSWFLRSILRAIRDRKFGRVITVVGRLDAIPEPDLIEVGRLLGRSSDALLIHSATDDSDRIAKFRHGLAQNEFPPPIVRIPTEPRAVARALSMLRPRDLLFVLADQPISVIRSLDRAQHQQPSSPVLSSISA
jgi:UDP-N-acetylmuramyl tripeptide synthase